MIVNYHKINEYAEQMGALGRIDPWAAIWVPYVFFCAFCYWMFHTLTKPGGQPIGALERVFSKASAGIVRLIVRDRKRVVSGRRVSVRVDLGGRRIIKKKKSINEIKR